MDIISPTKSVKTRKPHRCFACNREFKPGTIMDRQVNIYDDINTVYSCSTCKELMDKYSGYFLDESEDMFPSCCVTEAMSEIFDFHGSTPEDFLKFLNEKHKSK